jgi:hypothetical protein
MDSIPYCSTFQCVLAPGTRLLYNFIPVFNLTLSCPQGLLSNPLPEQQMYRQGHLYHPPLPKPLQEDTFAPLKPDWFCCSVRGNVDDAPILRRHGGQRNTKEQMECGGGWDLLCRPDGTQK